MEKAKVRAAPGPQSRIGAGRKRDESGRFVKGVSGNPGGTKHLSPEMKEFSRERSMKGLKKLDAMLDRETTQDKDVISIVRLFLEYGYGRPAAEYDKERLDLEKRRVDADNNRQDAGPRVIEVVFGEGAEDFAE